MVKEQHINQSARELNRIRREYSELESLLEYAETLEVDTTTDPGVAERHQEFLDDLEAFYYTLEEILASADRIEDDGGETRYDLPGNVPGHIADRIANRPEDRPNPDIPDRTPQ